MGGGQQGAGSAANTLTMEQLLQNTQRQQTADKIGQAFQQFGAGVARQQPYMQPGGGGQAALGPSTVPAQAQAIYAQGLGQLFPQGMGGAGGIDEQQLAMILSRLGYGGQGF